MTTIKSKIKLFWYIFTVNSSYKLENKKNEVGAEITGTYLLPDKLTFAKQFNLLFFQKLQLKILSNHNKLRH